MSKPKAHQMHQKAREFTQYLTASRLNFWYWDLPADFMLWARGTCEVFEVPTSLDNMLEAFRAGLDEEARAFLEAAKDQIIAAGEPKFEVRVNIRTSKGKVKAVEIRGEVVRDEDQAVGLFGICHDVTHLKQREMEVKSIQREAKIGFWSVEEKNKLFWSRAIREMTGATDDTKLPDLDHWIREYLNKEDQKGFRQTLAEAKKTGKAIETYFRQRSATGKEMVAKVLTMPSPVQPDKLIGSLQDFTEEKAIQNELAEQSTQFDEILQTMIVGVAKVNMEGVITFANEAAMRYLEDPHMVGRYHISDAIDQFDLEGNKINGEDLPLARSLRNGEVVSSFKHGLLINGKFKWFSVTSAPLMVEGKQTGAIANFIEITEEVEAQHLLEESEARFRKLIEEAPFAIQIYDREGTMIEANQQWEKIWGIKRENAIGWYNLTKDKSIREAGFGQHIKRAYSGQRGEFTADYYAPGSMPDKTRHLNTRYFPILNADGEVENVVVFNDDVSEKVQANKRLEESEEKFKAVAENLQGVTYMVKDKPFEVLYVNKVVKEVTGYAPEDMLSGKVNFLELIHPNDQKKNAGERERQLAEHQKYVIEYQLQRKNKKWIWIRDTGMGVYNEDGSLKYVVGYFEDVTDAKWAYEEIKLNESRFRAIFEGSGHGIGITDRNGLIVDVNRKFCDVLGYYHDEVIRKLSIEDMFQESGGQEHFIKLIKGQINTYQVESKLVKKNGGTIHARLNVSRYNDPATGEIRVVVALDDVTSSKRAQEAVRLSEVKFRSLFENAGLGIIISTDGGLIRETNPKALQMFGYGKGEMTGLSLYDLTHELDRPATEKRMEQLRTGKATVSSAEKRYVRKDGHSFWVAVSTSVFEDPATGHRMLVSLLEDIEEKRAILQEIRANERKFRSVFEETGHGIAILDENYDITTANRKFRQILGYTLKDLEAGIRPSDFTHPDEQTTTADILKGLTADIKKSVQRELRCVHKKGPELWVRLNASAYLDPVTSQLRYVWIVEDITRQKEALDMLRYNEEFQAETINALSLGLMVMNVDGQIAQTNTVWEQIARTSVVMQTASKGKDFMKLIKELPMGARIAVGLSAVINGHSPLFELEITLENNRWFSMRASKLHDQFKALVITLQDITVRKRVEQALEESLSKYRNIYNLTPVMMHSIDKDGTLVSVSNFWLEKLGYQRHEVIGRNIRDFLTEESKLDSDVVLPIFFEKGSIFDVSFHFKTKNGEVIEALLSAIEEGKGTQNPRSLAVVTDITDLKKAERQLKKNRQDLLEAQNIARLGNFDLDIATLQFTSSAVFDDILEITAQKDRHFNVLDRIAHPDELSHLHRIFQKSFTEGKRLEYVGPIITLKTKQVRWLQALGRVVMKDGKPARLVGTVQDITKNKLSELEIQKLSDRLKLAMEGANIGVWEEDLVTKKLHWEATMYDLFEMEPPITRNVWKEILENIHPDDRQNLTDMQEKLQAGQELVDCDYRYIVGGKVRHLRSITRRIKDASGNSERLVGVIMDITRDRELLRRLETSLSEKDILIKEVHHRVKNNMQMISSILSLKSLDLTDEDSKKVFDDCTVRIKSMAVVHDQLYRFYNVSEIDMSEYLHHLLSGLNALMGGRTGDYVIDIESEEFKMDVDVALLCGLIVSELVANAFKHGFKGHSEGRILVSFKVEGDKKVLTVTNSGNPLPPNVLEMRTSSLGMSLIKTFTTQLSGQISVHPDNGLQITF